MDRYRNDDGSTVTEVFVRFASSGDGVMLAFSHDRGQRLRRLLNAGIVAYTCRAIHA